MLYDFTNLLINTSLFPIVSFLNTSQMTNELTYIFQDLYSEESILSLLKEEIDLNLSITEQDFSTSGMDMICYSSPCNLDN
ncbi:MAG: hypothetical protein Pg6B_08170 [Candidatus Azobacteroides pseudotrichonymphae]|jgi:hypothetical protein|nr:MAG: hypothetical protein Pg6B_08170 [Candidatus Azobacteroides pseudotrichonymphae]